MNRNTQSHNNDPTSNVTKRSATRWSNFSFPRPLFPFDARSYRHTIWVVLPFVPRVGHPSVRTFARSLASFPRSVAREKAYRRYSAWASAWRRDHALICTVISGTRGESNLFHAAQGQWCDLTTPRSPRRSSDNTLAAIGHTASASKIRAPS